MVKYSRLLIIAFILFFALSGWVFAIESSSQMDTLTYVTTGYDMTISHPEVSNLALTSGEVKVVKTTSVSGNVYVDQQEQILKEGTVVAYRITPSGPFVAEDTAMISETGVFEFTDIGLGDFVFLAKPDRETYPLNQGAGSMLVMNTYAENSDIWTLADNKHIRQTDSLIQINMAHIMKPITLALGADISGEITFREVYEFYDDPDEGKLAARKKAAGVAVTLRRFTGLSGRILQDSIFQVYDYTETGTDGQFAFENVEEGIYKLHIDYPGLSMDPNAEIDFKSGSNWENKIFVVESIIREDGISVESKEILNATEHKDDQFLVYPNPNRGKVNLEFSVDQPLDQLRLEVIDFSGKKVMEKTLNSETGLNRLELELTSSQSGVYLIRIFSDSDEVLFQKRMIRL